MYFAVGPPLTAQGTLKQFIRHSAQPRTTIVSSHLLAILQGKHRAGTDAGWLHHSDASSRGGHAHALADWRPPLLLRGPGEGLGGLRQRKLQV